MAKKENPFPLTGLPDGQFKPEELTPAQLEQAQRDYSVMENLDKIASPIEAKIYGNAVWTYRNKAYRDMVNKMDIKAKEELYKIIHSKNPKK